MREVSKADILKGLSKVKPYTVILMIALFSLLVLKFHALVLYRESLNEDLFLDKPEEFRLTRYQAYRTLTYILYLASNSLLAWLIYKCIHERLTPKKLYALIAVVILFINALASLTAQITVLYPYKLKADRIIKALKEQNSAEKAVNLAVSYVDESLGNSYRKPEYMLELDESTGLIDYIIASALGLDRTHIILYQRWGSCGQYAILTTYLLSQAGYTTRIVHFKDRDHGWAEILLNGTWYIIDPWYIGKYFNNTILVPANLLSTKFPSTGVVVIYPNGTQVDVSAEHGYN